MRSRCHRNGQKFLFETGRETPLTLKRVIQDIEKSIGPGKVGNNLDPANLIIYGKGNPVDTLDAFGEYVCNVSGENADAEVKRMKDYAQVAAILGSAYLHHTIAPGHTIPNLASFDKLYQRGIAAVREIYDYANALGVKTIYKDQGYVFNGVEGFSRFLREVDRGVGIVDIAHCIQMLEKSGYIGCYGLEFSAGPGGETAMKEYIDQAVTWLE